MIVSIRKVETDVGCLQKALIIAQDTHVAILDQVMHLEIAWGVGI